jgi:hypothetical protein
MTAGTRRTSAAGAGMAAFFSIRGEQGRFTVRHEPVPVLLRDEEGEGCYVSVCLLGKSSALASALSTSGCDM